MCAFIRVYWKLGKVINLQSAPLRAAFICSLIFHSITTIPKSVPTEYSAYLISHEYALLDFYYYFAFILHVKVN